MTGNSSQNMVISDGHSGVMRSIEPGIQGFPDVQLQIWGLVPTHHPGMTHVRIACFAALAMTA
jgi:hypothetical protein